MPKISGIATGQILQVAGKKYKAKGCFDVQKNDFGERLMLFRRSFIIMDFVSTDTKYVIKYRLTSLLS